MEEIMILKMMHTSNGDVLIDGVEQITKVGITRDCGDNVEVLNTESTIGEMRKREDVLYDILSLYNLTISPEPMHVFNLVIRNNSDNRKEYRTVLFKGPGFLLNDSGHTMEMFPLLQ